MSAENLENVELVDYWAVVAFVGQVRHIYIFSRSEIGYVLSRLASHCNDPRRWRREHVEAAKILGRYLEDTRELGICYEANAVDEVNVYCDAMCIGMQTLLTN